MATECYGEGQQPLKSGERKMFPWDSPEFKATVQAIGTEGPEPAPKAEPAGWEAKALWALVNYRAWQADDHRWYIEGLDSGQRRYFPTREEAVDAYMTRLQSDFCEAFPVSRKPTPEAPPAPACEHVQVREDGYAEVHGLRYRPNAQRGRQFLRVETVLLYRKGEVPIFARSTRSESLEDDERGELGIPGKPWDEFTHHAVVASQGVGWVSAKDAVSHRDAVRNCPTCNPHRKPAEPPAPEPAKCGHVSDVRMRTGPTWVHGVCYWPISGRTGLASAAAEVVMLWKDGVVPVTATVIDGGETEPRGELVPVKLRWDDFTHYVRLRSNGLDGLNQDVAAAHVAAVRSCPACNPAASPAEPKPVPASFDLDKMLDTFWHDPEFKFLRDAIGARTPEAKPAPSAFNDPELGMSTDDRIAELYARAQSGDTIVLPERVGVLSGSATRILARDIMARFPGRIHDPHARKYDPGSGVRTAMSA